MKHIALLLFLVTFASCGTVKTKFSQLRYVKVADQEIAVIEKPTSTNTLEIKESNFEKEIEKEEISYLKTTADVLNNEKLLISDKTIQPVKVDQKETNQVIADDDAEIANQAIRAEKNASAAMFLSIAGILTIIPYLGIFPLLLGFIFYIRANSSRYITPFGENRLKVSKAFLIIDSVIFLLWVIFIVALIILW